LSFILFEYLRIKARKLRNTRQPPDGIRTDVRMQLGGFLLTRIGAGLEPLA
jgi:hypothetical protein